MQPALSPLVEAFLVVDQPRQRLSHWLQVLGPLDDPRAPALAGVAAYYDPTSDQALIGLRYDELALGRERLAFVIEIALLGELGMIQPAELSEGDRRRFLGERLARCVLHVVDQRAVAPTLSELARQIRDHNSRRTPLGGLRPLRPPGNVAARGSLAPRGDTDDSDAVLLVKAKSTRDDLETQAEDAPVRAVSPHVVSRANFVRTAQMPAYEAQKILAEMRASEGVTAQPVALATPPPPAAPRATPSPPPPPLSGSAIAPGMIRARFQRNGRWVPVRIGALSLRGAALMTGALPRLGDPADVALTFGDHRAVVRGPVVKVSTPEEVVVTGTATFSVAFALDDTSRRQLTALLTAARHAQVMIQPPPPRHGRRFPVEWPVCLGTTRGAIRAEALDVSAEGMFVRTTHGLPVGAALSFSVVLDDGGGPVSGRARVIRELPDTEARPLALSPGYGLRITEMPAPDLARWGQFIDRVSRRVAKRVLVGAPPERLAELKAALVALGYAVTTGTDPGALVQLASSDRPVDAVLLDATWLAPGDSASYIESLFAARNVPCVRTDGDARRTRDEIDRVLTVV